MSAAPVILAPSAGPGIGLGHLQRLRALAAALGEGVRFLLPEAGRAEALGLGVDPGAILAPGPGLPPGAVVVLDCLHHGNAGATVARVAALKAAGHPVAVIDSMPPDHYPDTGPEAVPDLLVTPYLGADRLRPRPPGRWLAGPDWAILPPDLAVLRDGADPAEARGFLVTCGGADPAGLSLTIAETLAGGRHPVALAVGPGFDPGLTARLQALAAVHAGLVLHLAPPSLIPLIAGARMVIGRPGLIRYEAAAMGRKGLYLFERSEYRPYFEGFSASGLADIRFATDPGGMAGFTARLRDLAGAEALPMAPDPGLVAVIDGQGAARVAAEVAALRTGV